MDKDLESIFLNALEQSQHTLFRICSSYAKNTDDAQDLFQEVLINIWKALPNFRNNADISTWMYRITLNVSLRHRTSLNRDKKRFSEFKGISIESIPQGGITDDEHQKLTFLRQCVRQLNDADKALITLYLEELPYKEISTVTGLKENTVAVKIKRIKKKLLNCITEKL